MSIIDRLAEIVATNDPRPLRARHAADLIRAGTDARWVGIYTVADGMVSNEVWSGPAAPAHPTFPVSQGLTAHAIGSKSVAVSNDVAHDSRYLTNQDDTGSELILPISVGDVIVGTLDVESGAVGAFDDDAVRAFEKIAHALTPLWSHE